MAKALSTSLTRRRAAAGLTLTAAAVAVAARMDAAQAQTQQTMAQKSLYERLGGAYSIAVVVDGLISIFRRNL